MNEKKRKKNLIWDFTDLQQGSHNWHRYCPQFLIRIFTHLTPDQLIPPLFWKRKTTQFFQNLYTFQCYQSKLEITKWSNRLSWNFIMICLTGKIEKKTLFKNHKQKTLHIFIVELQFFFSEAYCLHGIQCMRWTKCQMFQGKFAGTIFRFFKCLLTTFISTIFCLHFLVCILNTT